MGKHLFYLFRVTNSTLKNKYFSFELRTRTSKNQITLIVTNPIPGDIGDSNLPLSCIT